MINRSKQVDMDDAAPGMVLAEAVLDGQNAVLLPAATELTESMLRSLQRRGIEHVFVVDDSVSPEEWEAECRRVQARLDRLFRICRGKGASDILLGQILEYRTGGGK
jgi:hypothetical protein